MLVLSRSPGVHDRDTIILEHPDGSVVAITIQHQPGKQNAVAVCIEAPRHIHIVRAEKLTALKSLERLTSFRPSPEPVAA